MLTDITYFVLVTIICFFLKIVKGFCKTIVI